MIEVKESPPPPSAETAAAPVSKPKPLGPALGPSRKGVKDQIIERYEKKYLIHPRLMPQIRKWLENFCIPDPNAKGEIPEYITTTMQLDTPFLHLAIAGERKLANRFKMRIRTYGTDSNPKNAIFVELKRRINGMVVKSRSRLSRAIWHPKIITHPETCPLLKSAKDNSNFLDFCRLARELGTRPKILIRYIRESYFSANDDYARVTFDRRISYRTHTNWMLPGEEVADWKYWRPLDTQMGFGVDYPAYILELKAMVNAPTWMLELAERFNLDPVGFCKYATACRLENNYINGISYNCEMLDVSPYSQVFF
ncbi:MAG: polyphosphate polymerase domain-containing protein [Verrucomicrobiales bacterium]|nr:polyphosphate polymerase domain-containing protein [Verrucomicrobiales bacterium]